MEKFNNDSRYSVIDRIDMAQALSVEQMFVLAWMNVAIGDFREKAGNPRDVEAVVVTKDMACYEAVRKLVEDEVNGKV